MGEMAISPSMSKTSLLYFCDGEKIKSFQNFFIGEKEDDAIAKYYKAPSIYCITCNSIIPDLAKYYYPLNEEYKIMCVTCHKKEANKQQWGLAVNNRVYEEPMVTCTLCNKRYHAISVMANVNSLIKGDDFVCPSCMVYHLNITKKEKLPYPKSWGEALKAPDVKNLRTTVLSNKIEAALCDSSLFVRELQSPGKMLGLFQLRDGVYVLLFFVSLQYKGGDNLYLSYIDSIHYYNNKEKRTWMYQTFILSIFDNARKKGIRKVFLWSMPPLPNMDYFFNKHPPEQLIPQQDKLTMWYLNLFQRGREEKIIKQSLNLWEFIEREQIKSYDELPRFDGDFWPTVLDEEKTIEENTAVVFSVIKDAKNNLLMCYLDDDGINYEMEEDDEGISYPIVSSREVFLDNCGELLLQFHTLRHARYSTMMILFYMCNPSLQFQAVICNKCHRLIPCTESFFSDVNKVNYELCSACALNNAPTITGVIISNLPIIIQSIYFNLEEVKDHVCLVNKGRCLYCIEKGIVSHARSCIDKACPVLMCQKHKKKTEDRHREYLLKRSQTFLLSI
jgi:hypothetical protein